MPEPGGELVVRETSYKRLFFSNLRRFWRGLEGQICVSELATIGSADEPTVWIRRGYGGAPLCAAAPLARGVKLNGFAIPAGERVSAKADKLAAFPGSADQFDPGMVEGEESD
jgi:hypothetical protein